jgi:hypothetical protein
MTYEDAVIWTKGWLNDVQSTATSGDYFFADLYNAKDESITRVFSDTAKVYYEMSTDTNIIMNKAEFVKSTEFDAHINSRTVSIEDQIAMMQVDVATMQSESATNLAIATEAQVVAEMAMGNIQSEELRAKSVEQSLGVQIASKVSLNDLKSGFSLKDTNGVEYNLTVSTNGTLVVTQI